MKEIPQLDGLRALAVGSVILAHATALTVPMVGGAWYAVATQGWIGVDIFFVISGYLITRILLETREAPGYFTSFYVRRFVRIFPLYYAALAVVLVLIPALAPGLVHDARHLSANQWSVWTYVSNLVIAVHGSWQTVPPLTEHFWSLAVEEQFYLVWPAVVLFSGPRTRRLSIAVLLGSWALRAAARLAGASPIALFVFTPTRMDALAAGAVVATLQSADMARLRKPAAWVFGACAIAVAGLLALGGDGQYSVGMQCVGLALIAIGTASVILRLVGTAEAGGKSGILSHPWMRHIGRRSYAIYVLHPLFVKAAERVWQARGMSGPWGQVGFYIVVVAATGAAAELSWHAWEKHWLALKRFVPRPERLAPAARIPAAVLDVVPGAEAPGLPLAVPDRV